MTILLFLALWILAALDQIGYGWLWLPAILLVLELFLWLAQLGLAAASARRAF